MQVGSANRQLQDRELLGQLVKSTNSGEALRLLYAAYKLRHRKYSLSYFCKRAGISSTGYLSDVIKGKRTLHEKYKNQIAKAFHLEDHAAEYLRTLVEQDHATSSTSKAQLSAKLKVLRKNLLTVVAPMPSGQGEDLFFALELFCAFGLFSNKPNKEDLYTYFTARGPETVDRALAILDELGLVKPGKAGGFQLLTEQILFAEEAGGISHVDFIRLSLQQAAKGLPEWFSRKEEASFVSSVISVDRKQYKAQLEQLKKQLVEAQSEFESSNADLLIRFNIQIFPIS